MTSGSWNPGFQDSRKALELASFDWFQNMGYVSHSFLVKQLDFECRISKLHHSWKLPEISWNSGYCPGIGQFWLISIHRVYFPLNFSQGTWFSMQNLKISSFLEVSRAISRVPGNFYGMMMGQMKWKDGNFSVNKAFSEGQCQWFSDNKIQFLDQCTEILQINAMVSYVP